jgi:hypothetical protein
VAKVKKGTGVRGERNGKGKAARGKAKGTTKTARKRPGKRPAARKGATKKGTVRSRPVVGPVVRVAVKALDPLRKCGPNTSVQLLYRVDEEVGGRNTPHLVFFDRHGWYCEHGRSCPAVGHARKFKGQIARVS